METIFEKLVKIAKEGYGVNITRKESDVDSTFESLFGISVDDIPEPELPYEIPDVSLVIDFCEPVKLEIERRKKYS